MLIEVQTTEECRSLIDIIDRMEDIGSPLLDGLKSAVECFRIRNSIDFIGPMKCDKCNHDWIAIFPKSALSLECPRCNAMVEVPKQKQEEKGA
jgi:ribosomal protein S27E